MEINYTKSILISTLTFCFLFLLSCESDNYDSTNIEVQKIELVSMNWSILTRSRITSKNIWDMESDIFHDTIKEESSFKKIINMLKLIDTISTRNNKNIDVRISLKVYRPTKIDTLSFGHTNAMEYNGKIYNLDQVIFSDIVNLLPNQQARIIDDFKKETLIDK